MRFALPLYLLKETHSASLFGLVSALSFMPMIVLMPIGGIIADRVNKRKVMVVLDFLTAILMVLLFLLLGKVSLVPLLIVSMMLLFGIQGAYQPAVQASIPLLQNKDRLLQANAIINQVNALAGLLAPVIGGILFSSLGIMPIIVVGGFCFFFSAVMEIFIYIPHTKRQENLNIFGIVKQDFSESFTFMGRDKPVILQSIGILCAVNLFLSAMLIVAMPVLITQTLAMSDRLYGYSQGVLAAGGLVGGAVVGVFASKLSVNKVSSLLVLNSLFLLPIAFSLWLNLPHFISYLVITISCVSATMTSVQMLSFVQGETPPNLTGKVISCLMALCMCSQPIGQSIYGFLFDYFKSTPYLIIIASAIASLIVALYSRYVFKKL